jgi:hypothetical protein
MLRGSGVQRHVGSSAIYPLDYNVFKDLQPIALLAASPLWSVRQRLDGLGMVIFPRGSAESRSARDVS